MAQIEITQNYVVYQCQTVLVNLASQVALSRSKTKPAIKAAIQIATQIRLGLEALNYSAFLTKSQIDEILYILVDVASVNALPYAPVITTVTPPTILVGIPGPAGTNGTNGATGARGPAGLATDFNVGPSTISIVADSFPISNAKAARWDYLILDNSTLASRAGSVVGHWASDGSVTECTDISDNDTVNPTDGLEFDVSYSGGNIFFVANITSGNWTIWGTRYFIPNNGLGTGPINGALPHNRIYIGNLADQAQAQAVTGAISVTDTGVTSLNTQVIFDAAINNSAGIQVSKLQALTPSQLVVTNSSGFLTTIAAPTIANIGFFDISSSLTTQLAGKMADPTTSVGDLIYRNGANVLTRLGVGGSNQVLTISGGVPAWITPAAGFSDPMTTAGDIIIRNGGNVTSRLGIGSSGKVLTVSGGVPTWATPTATGVTSVGVTQPAAGFTITGTNPITSTGTFTFALSDDLAGVEAVNTTGIVRRTAPNVWSAGSTVLVSEGGTNLTSYTTGDLIYASSTNVLSQRGIGGTGQLLYVASGVPTWSGVRFTWDGNTLNINDGVTYANLQASSLPGVSSYFQGGTGTVGTPKGADVLIDGGAPYITNGSGGTISINAGSYTGLGTAGDVTISSGTLNGGLLKLVGATGDIQINSSGGGQVWIGFSTTAATTRVYGQLQFNRLVGTVGTGSTPTIFAGAGAGVATGGVASLTNATDAKGVINFTVGSGGGSSFSAVVTVTFNVAYGVAPVVGLTPANLSAADGMVNRLYYVTSTTTGFVINTTAAIGAGSSQVINYHVIG